MDFYNKFFYVSSPQLAFSHELFGLVSMSFKLPLGVKPRIETTMRPRGDLSAVNNRRSQASRGEPPPKRWVLSILSYAIARWRCIPERSWDDLLGDLTAMRAAMIDLSYVLEGYMKGLIWLISLPVRILTGLASLAVALCVLLPLILIILMATGNTSGSALERASESVTNNVANFLGTEAGRFSRAHPDTWLGKMLAGDGPNEAPIAPNTTNQGQIVLPPLNGPTSTPPLQ